MILLTFRLPYICKVIVFVKTTLPGQSLLLQISDSRVLPEHIPPSFSLTNLVPVLDLFPPPHVLVQDENELQLPHLQFTESKTKVLCMIGPFEQNFSYMLKISSILAVDGNCWKHVVFNRFN